MQHLSFLNTFSEGFFCSPACNYRLNISYDGNSGSTAAVQEEGQQREQAQSVTNGNNHLQVIEFGRQ